MKISLLSVSAFVALLFLLQSCEEHKLENKSDHSIGFEVLRFFREAIPFFPDSLGIKDRPVFARVWYPTEDSSNALNFGSYFSELNAEENYIKGDNQIALSLLRLHRLIRSFADLDSGRVKKVIDSLYLTESGVSLSPSPREGKYPLVIVAGGLPEYHLYLIEQIASKGFVVASIPRLGFSLSERLPFDADGATLVKEDLTHLVTELTKLEFVDASQLFWVAWSYEGIPSLMAATEFENTRAVISLDASLGYSYGPSLLPDSVSFAATKFSFPIVHITGLTMDHGKSFSLLHSLSKHSLVKIITIPKMSHAQFTSLKSAVIPSFSGRGPYTAYLQSTSLVFGLLNGSEVTEEIMRAIVSQDTTLRLLSVF